MPGCLNCSNCNGTPVKEGAAIPVAIICDLSSGAANCPNPDVSVLNVCDSTGAPFLEVILSCNGVPQATPTYLNFDLTPATPVLPVTSCNSAFSVSTETACIRLVADDSIVDNVEIVKVIDTTTGSILTLRVFSLDGVTEYTLPLPPTQRLGSCELSYQTFEINEVCADGAKAFRVEQRQLDGSSTVVFYGTNGAILTPVTWIPGSCAGNAPNSISMVQVCANGGTPAFRREVIDDADVSTVTFLGLNGAPFVPVSWFAGECPQNLTDALDDQLVCADGLPAFRHETLDENGVSTVVFIGVDGTLVTPVTWIPGSCTDCVNYTETIVCAAGVQLIRRVDCQGTLTFIGSDGVTVPTPASYTIGACSSTIPTTDSLSVQTVCADGSQAFRRETLDENGVSTVTFLSINGAVIVPTTWEPGNCSDCDSFTESIVCASGTQLLKRTNNCTGVDTFIGSDGVVVPTPLTYTIGECVSVSAVVPVAETTTLVCADGLPATRKEILFSDSTTTVVFLGIDDTIIVPTTWFPGECLENLTDSVVISEVCADGSPAFRKEVTAENGVTTVTFLGVNGATIVPTTWTPGNCLNGVVPVSETLSLICADGAPAFRKEFLFSDSSSTVTFLSTDGSLIVPTTWIPGECLENLTDSVVISEVCADGVPAFRKEVTTEAGVTTVTFLGTNGVVIVPTIWTPGDCAECLNYTETIVCANGVQLIRRVDCEGTVTFVGTDGVTVATPASYTIGDCDVKLIQACDTFTNAPLAPVCGVDAPSAVVVDSTQTATEALNGAIAVDPSSARMANNISFTEHSLGMRFQVNIPQGSQICEAIIQFTAQQSQEVLPFSAVVSAEDVDNSAAFVAAGAGNFDIQNRAKTVTTIWNDNTDWGNGESGLNQQSPDLTAQVQQVVNRPLWVANNIMGIFVEPTTGMHRVRTQIGGTLPQLRIKYFPPTGLQPVTVCIPFFMEVTSDNTPTGNNYFIDPADNTWKPYTIQGTVTQDDCKCDANDAYTYQTICLQDANNIQFIRIFKVNVITSVATLVGDFLQDFSSSYSPVGSTVACNDTTYDTEIVTLCDNNGAFLRNVVYNELGNVDTVYDTTVDGVTPYTTVGTVGTCSGDSFTETIVCAAGVSLIRRTASDGTLTFISSNGTIVAAPVAYTIGACTSTDIEAVQLCFTANTAGVGYNIGDQVIDVRWFNTATNTQVSEVAFNVTQGGSAVATPLTAADFDECATNSIDREFEVLCDTVGNFLRRYSVTSAGVVAFTDTTMDGVTPYVPVGTVGTCVTTIPDREFEVLCDTVGSFLRRYSVSSTGVVTIVNTTLDGTTAYVPVGAVGTCNPATSDREFEVLCDTVGTFLRRYSVSSTGVVTTTDTTLDGTTAYVVTGAVDICKCSQINPAIDSTLVRQTGAGVVTILSGARSVTVTVLAGAPTVSIGGAAAVTLIAGLSMTWEIDLGGTAGEALQDSFAFTGNAASDFYVHTTREI